MHASQEITPFSVLLFLGTDATHAEHIETIKTRMYIGVNNDGRFVPGQLGMGLVEGRCLKNVLGIWLELDCLYCQYTLNPFIDVNALYRVKKDRIIAI